VPAGATPAATYAMVELEEGERAAAARFAHHQASY
jgi:hypothetical protein